jgi:hypothetical protein
MGQNRAPAVLPHHHELARQAPDQPRGHRSGHRGDYYRHRLRARAKPGTGSYPPGATISGEQMAALPLRRHGWHGDWNYTLYPSRPPPRHLPRHGPAAANAPAGRTPP